MNYNEIRRSVGRDLFEIFILPVDPKRLGLDAGVAGDRRRKRDFARWFVWPGQLFGWNVAGRYCTGLKIPWRHPNRHERECGLPLPSHTLFPGLFSRRRKFSHFGTRLFPNPTTFHDTFCTTRAASIFLILFSF